MSFKVPEKTVFLWQLRIALVFAALLPLFIYLCFISLWFLILTGIIYILCLILLFFIIPNYILSYKITIRGESISISRGFLIKSEYIMPTKRIIFSTAFSSPISRKLGLSGLILRVTRAFLIIPEIKSEDTEKIKQFLGGGPY